MPCDTWEGCYYQPHIASNRTGDGWHSHCLRCSERIVFLGYDGQGHWVVDPFVIEEEP
ncbi:MAG TPA: hypothetical protein VFH56_02870 [Acidimicrobiales bacterium]|nr:hypothetical protein [Acidimicrobiales bacterium]